MHFKSVKDNIVMTELNATEVTEKKSLNFIEQAVENDLKEGKNGNRVQTRFRIVEGFICALFTFFE